jgi:recombination protein RecR
VIFGSPLLARLVTLFKKMPGVGEKSAQRLALWALRSDRATIEDLSRTLLDIKDKVGFCEVCANVAEGPACVICLDLRRSDDAICVVEQPQDIYVLERTGAFHGRYHVLHGALSPLDGIGPEDLRLANLPERVRTARTREVIVATNPTLEGDATALYVGQLLHGFGVRVTRLARGLPVGGSIELLDEATLGRAFEGRAEV